jgi:ADP-ribose pyrophosphatase YjhB (NUDIX family)
MAKHFIAQDFPFQATKNRLPDKTYSQALDRLVISTLDIIVVKPNGKILLGKRCWEPLKGEFFLLGGSRQRGESFELTAARLLNSELGIEAETTRFQALGFYSFAFSKRRQPPRDHGVHTDSHVFMVKLTSAEVALIKPNREYLEMMWVLPNELVKRVNEFHPAIVQICQDFIAMRAA